MISKPSIWRRGAFRGAWNSLLVAFVVLLTGSLLGFADTPATPPAVDGSPKGPDGNGSEVEVNVETELTPAEQAASVGASKAQPQHEDTRAASEEGVCQASRPSTEASRPGKSFRGLVFDDVPVLLRKHLRQRLNPRSGVVVARVEPGSPATECGLEIGDIVIAFDKTMVYSPLQLQQLLAMYAPEMTATVLVLRAAEKVTVPVRLEQHNCPAKKELVPFDNHLEVSTFHVDSSTAVLTNINGQIQLRLHLTDQPESATPVTWTGDRAEIARRVESARIIPAPLKEMIRSHLGKQD